MSSTARNLLLRSSPFRSRNPPTTPINLSSFSSPTSSSATNTVVAEGASNMVDENVTVTVRFRPLSQREIRKGDNIAWHADGDYTVRNESNPSISFGYDKVFGPATTTHHVYDVAAQHVVSGAMQGINGTVFAYGVTSSGKTYTMHGEQKSPGIIPLAVKDVFDIIQETPEREFLLRVSYMEIYNEVINDLLDPTGQNLRIREDAQGTYVVDIKEEVVLSPAHTLSLIASGEEHRHVGSNNFNLLSSRSHTIFTLTIESSPCGENQGTDVRLSQLTEVIKQFNDVKFPRSPRLNLIDLAGSESSKTETTGLRRKEGSYINKSLLTLGTVISKLTDGKSTHIPYRDSKLTRLLQSSLSGFGRISLICTLTPASSNREETHNTLTFAHRSKHVQIKASQNKIVDDKSLIKKYQKEISCLKQELQQLKYGMTETNQEDVVNLKLQLKAGQVKLQSRLEEEEHAKAALLGRIQRLTKLILVSTKNAVPSAIAKNPGYRRSYSICEDELAYLPNRRRTSLINEDAGSYGSETSSDEISSVSNLDALVKDYKMNMRSGKLGWFKLNKPESSFCSSMNSYSESSVSGSPVSLSKPGESRVAFTETNHGTGKSISMLGDKSSTLDSFRVKNGAGDLYSATVGRRILMPSATNVIDQMDLLQEQVKLLAGEMAFCNSSLKRLSEAAANKPYDSQIQEKILTLEKERKEKEVQLQAIEQRIVGSVEATRHTLTTIEMSQALSKLATQLNEKTFELEIKSADNRILQEQLQMKVSETAELQQTILLLRRELDSVVLANSSNHPSQPKENGIPTDNKCSESLMKTKNHDHDKFFMHGEICFDESPPTSVMNSSRMLFNEELSESSGGSQSDNRGATLETALYERGKTEDLLLKPIGESKQSEGGLRNELADMWMLGAKLKKTGIKFEKTSSVGNYNFDDENMVAGKKNWSSDNNYFTTC